MPDGISKWFAKRKEAKERQAEERFIQKEAVQPALDPAFGKAWKEKVAREETERTKKEEVPGFPGYKREQLIPITEKGFLGRRKAVGYITPEQQRHLTFEREKAKIRIGQAKKAAKYGGIYGQRGKGRMGRESFRQYAAKRMTPRERVTPSFAPMGGLAAPSLPSSLESLRGDATTSIPTTAPGRQRIVAESAIERAMRGDSQPFMMGGFTAKTKKTKSLLEADATPFGGMASFGLSSKKKKSRSMWD